MEQNDLPAACVTALTDLVGWCGDYHVAHSKSPEKTKRMIRGKIIACSQILLKSDIQDLNPRKTIPVLAGTKRKIDEALYNEHLVPLIIKLQGMLESKRKRQFDSPCLPLQFMP